MKKKLIVTLAALLAVGVFTSLAVTAIEESAPITEQKVDEGAGDEFKGDDDDDDDDDDNGGSTLLVDNDGVQCPNAQFSSIQAAVLAASAGDTIRVCPGTYPEQVRIDKNLTVVGIPVRNENLILLSPGAVTPNTTSLTSGAPIAAIIVADGARKVDLQNLTVDGANNGLNSCVTNFAGIYYRNASGRIDSVAVRNIKLGPGGEGCQTGLGVYAQSSNAGSARMEVRNSSIHDYQKAGIVGNEVNTEVLAFGNAITGVGPIFNNTQIGVQLGFGADGNIDGNSIINHIFAGCADASCSTISTGVFLFNAGNAKVRRNNIGKNQTGITMQTNGAEASSNFVFDSDVFNGIAIINGDNNRVDRNTVFNSDGGAIAVAGNQNRVHSNTVNEAPAGVVLVSGSSGNNIRSNQFFNTRENVTTLNLGARQPTADGASATLPTVSAVRD